MVGCTAEGLYHLVVAGTGSERGGRRVGATTEVGVVTTVYAVVVEHDDGHGELVAADGLYLHATEAEGTVALDGEDLLAAGDGCSYGIAHADAHHAPGAGVETEARTVHVDDVARVVERVGSLVHEVDVLVALHHIAHRLERVEVVHGRGGRGELGLHLDGVGLLDGINGIAPLLGALDVEVVHLGNHHVERGDDVAHYGRCDGSVAVDLFRFDVELDKLRRGVPLLALAVGEQPVETGTDEHYHIGLTEHEATRRGGTLGMVVGQEPLGH